MRKVTNGIDSVGGGTPLSVAISPATTRMGPPIVLAVSVAALLAACSGTGSDPTPRSGVNRPAFTEEEYGVRTSPRVAEGRGRMPKGGGSFKIGNPYRVAGRWYVPREDPGYDRRGMGSWYGDDFHGRRTANGEIFDMHGLTAAHPTLPLPSYAYVTNLENGRTILVRVNDRGPYVRDRIIDLSHASARALGYDRAGRAHVRVRSGGRAPLNGDDRRERQYLASQPFTRGGRVGVAAAAPLPVPRPVPASRSRGWSPAEYRAGLAGKPVPKGFAPPPRSGYAVSAADLPPSPAANTSRNAAPQRQSRLTWKASPPSQPASWATSTATGSTAGRSALGAGAAFVDVGSYRDRATAERLQGELAHLGSIEVAPLATGGGGLYRVRIGPMPATQAHATLREVNARGIASGTITIE